MSIAKIESIERNKETKESVTVGRLAGVTGRTKRGWFTQFLLSGANSGHTYKVCESGVGSGRDWGVWVVRSGSGLMMARLRVQCGLPPSLLRSLLPPPPHASLIDLAYCSHSEPTIAAEAAAVSFKQKKPGTERTIIPLT